MKHTNLFRVIETKNGTLVWYLFASSAKEALNYTLKEQEYERDELNVFGPLAWEEVQ